MSEFAASTLQSFGSEQSFSSDPLSNLFEPDVLLPSQFMVADEMGVQGGERRLMAAILSDGIEAYIAQSTSDVDHAKRRIDAKEWVDTRDYSYVFSFDVVCESLGIDAEYLRLGLYRYVQAIHTCELDNGSEKPVWKKIRRPRKQ